MYILISESFTAESGNIIGPVGTLPFDRSGIKTGRGETDHLHDLSDSVSALLHGETIRGNYLYWYAHAGMGWITVSKPV